MYTVSVRVHVWADQSIMAALMESLFRLLRPGTLGLHLVSEDFLVYWIPLLHNYPIL